MMHSGTTWLLPILVLIGLTAEKTHRRSRPPRRGSSRWSVVRPRTLKLGARFQF
jgi:hypothetical protein